jgi:predicted DNA-binding WGR domain protein
MKIEDELIKPYYIDSDGTNFDVMEDTGYVNKAGNTMKRNHGHFSSVESALNKIAKLMVEKKDSVYTIKGYVEALREIKIKIEI